MGILLTKIPTHGDLGSNIGLSRLHCLTSFQIQFDPPHEFTSTEFFASTGALT